MSNKVKKDSLIHISRRDSMILRKNIGLRVLSVFLAFMVCSIILLIYKGYGPINFISTLFKGTIGDSFNIWTFLGTAAILLGLGLALIPAFLRNTWCQPCHPGAL